MIAILTRATNENKFTMRSWRGRFSIGLISLVALFVLVSDSMFLRTRLLAALSKPNQYSYPEIAKTAPLLKTFHPHLLVFNGKDFEVYNLDKIKQEYIKDDPPHCGRCGKMVPLMIHALRQLNATRFQPGQPVFEILFSDGDSPSSVCMNKGQCDVESFAPIMMFGSSLIKAEQMPQVQGLPNWFYLSCIYDYIMTGVKHCHWAEKVDHTQDFESLIPTVIWRGSDFCFLPDIDEFKFKGARAIKLDNHTAREQAVKLLMDHWNDLPPRWRGVALTAKAELKNSTWIDTKFTGPFGVEQHKRFAEHGVVVSTDQKMDSLEMGHYKYQIDYGGGGGTSWRGTLTKLGMPGVLFHHQTPTKDWFFDEMVPYVHYIPVSWHLGDLREKFLWAETHQVRVKEIAQAATALFEYFMSEPYMKKVYNEFFVSYLGQLLDAHTSPAQTWPELRKGYEDDGFRLHRVVTCNEKECTTDIPHGNKETQSWIPAVATES